MNIKTIKFTFSFTILFIILTSVFGQRTMPENILTDVKPAGCERNNVILEQAHKEAGTDSIIILIGRPGKKDKREDITNKRLYTSRAYLTQYLNWRTDKTTITGQSQNNGYDYGVVEIYIKGVLFDVLASYPDVEIGLGSCDSLESDDKQSRAKRILLYPWLYKKKSVKND
jgi:hypothetical protein